MEGDASCVRGCLQLDISEELPEIEKKEPGWTFFMIGSTASVLLDEDDAAARPFGMCESGTRMGLCRRMDRFFCDLPMIETLCDSVRRIVDYPPFFSLSSVNMIIGE